MSRSASDGYLTVLHAGRGLGLNMGGDEPFVWPCRLTRLLLCLLSLVEMLL